MLRSKLGLMGLCVMVLGVMAISASAAQASLFQWLILDETGTTATELEAPVLGTIDSPHVTLLTHLVGLAVSITCTQFTTTGVSLKAEGKLSEGGKVTFTGCEAYENGVLGTALECEVHTAGKPVGTVASNEGKGELILSAGGELVTKIEPLGEAFVTILTEGCALPEANPVHGVLVVKDCEGKAETHEVEHLIEEGPGTSLWVGADNEEHLLTSIDGSGWVFLGGDHAGLEWAGMHNL